jgi:hypothetical protein
LIVDEPGDRGVLRHELFGRLDHLSTAVVTAVLAGPMHDFRIATVVAIHKLGRLQFVVVRRPPLTGARFRMSSFRNSHDSVFQKNERVVRVNCDEARAKQQKRTALLR